ncbi:MAG: hypothetical protein H6R01_1731, partial [Burkholderiaceae bacterium]|nr:hypothetical protein [Burkholderiaceae bacterium]
MLIGGHMARNQGALQILQNSAPGEGTYGADGRHNIRTSGRNFVVG